MSATWSLEASALRDHRARRRIATQYDAAFIVEAGAGTGKTGALVGRIVGLIVDKIATIDQIAAITFTDAAASELRARVSEALSAKASTDPENEAVLAALDQLDDALITTIHGFCERILADHALTAGLPLRIEVLDEIGSALAFDESFGRLLDELYEDRTMAAIVQAATLLGAGAAQLRGLSQSLHSDVDAARRLVSDVPGQSDLDLVESVHLSARRITDALSDLVGLKWLCSDDTDRLFGRLVGLHDALVEGTESKDWIDEMFWMLDLDPQRVGNLGRQDAWQGEGRDVIREAFAAYEAARTAALQTLGQLVLSRLGHRFAQAALSAFDQRRARGALSFSDLLVIARDLVVTNSRARRSLQRAIRFILVDEFQDTDPVQLELICALGVAGNGYGASSLFFVGDPRQSIYRFRGADVALYERAKAEVVGVEVVALTENFRSVAPIIEFVGGVLGKSADGSVPALVAGVGLDTLFAVRPAAPGPSPVALFGGAAQAGTRARSRRQSEAVDIARVIVSALDGETLVGDADGRRGARLSDIALLVPRRTGLSEIELALERAQIPYRLASSTLIYESVEVQELLACLRAIDQPGDERALVGALRTSIFACSDVELAAYVAAGGEWRLDRAPLVELPDYRRVVDALGRIGSYRNLEHAVGLVGLVEQMIESEQVAQSLGACAGGAESLRRVKFLLDRVRSFTERGGTTLRELLLFSDLERATGARGVEVPPLDGDEAIRIMTVHGAKGLEFPIVVLGELGGSLVPAGRSAGVLKNSTSVELRASRRLESEGYATLFDQDQQREREEAWRLFYVAATRARDHLFISTHHTPSAHGDGSIAEIVSRRAERRSDLWRPLDVERIEASVKRPEMTGSVESVPGPGVDSVRYEQWKARRSRLVASLARPPVVSATSLGHSEQNESGGFRARPSVYDEDPLAWSRRTQASAVGRAVHAVLQRADLTDPNALDTDAVAPARRYGVEHARDEVVRLSRSVLASSAVRKAAGARACYRELPLVVAVSDGVLECVLDLCYESDDGFVIVDYKTDAVRDTDQIEALAGRYRRQAGAYALGLSRATGVTVAEVVLVFASPSPEAIEFHVPDLAGAMDEAAEALVQAFAGPVVP